jgi:hypothetical protein
MAEKQMLEPYVFALKGERNTQSSKVYFTISTFRQANRPKCVRAQKGEVIYSSVPHHNFLWNLARANFRMRRETFS